MQVILEHIPHPYDLWVTEIYPSHLSRLISFYSLTAPGNILGPVVQSIVSLAHSSVVKMLTVLINTISISQVFLQMQKLLTFFSKNISVYAIFNVQSFNNTLTSSIVSFEKLGPDQTAWMC